VCFGTEVFVMDWWVFLAIAVAVVVMAWFEEVKKL